MALQLLAHLRPELDEIESYVPASPAGIEVRLDANEAPLPREPELAEIVARATAAVTLSRYPDARMTELRARIAAHTGAGFDEILVGAGSDEIIALLFTALARPRADGAKPLVSLVSPTFGMYRTTARAHGYRVQETSLDETWDLDVGEMSKAIAADPPHIVFLASPNNPTGNVMSTDRIEAILEAASSSLVVVDEAYADYAAVGSLRRLRARYPHLAILRTVSKIGLAALRVGWIEAAAPLVHALDKVRQPFNVSATSQAAAAAVLAEGWPAVAREVALVVAERERLAKELSALGLEVTPSEANFVWVRTRSNAAAVYQGLVQRGVLVRSFHGSGGRLARQLRVTAGTPAEGDRLLEALRASLP